MPLQLSLFDRLERPSEPGQVLVARGPLATEAMLLARIEALAAETRKDPSLLARPVRIVVPSRSLRAHVGAAIVRSRGRSVAGVTVQTLFGLACEVLERGGEPAPRGMPLFDVLAQRLARAEPALRKGLEGLVDGYAAVVGTVRDLVDAGLEPEHAEAVDEALATDGPRAAGRAEVERARALVRVAARTEDLLRGLGLGRASTLLRKAADLLTTEPDRALPARAVLIHGFAEATGVVSDLLQALLRNGATLVLDQPPQPAVHSVSPGFERAFTERLSERLAGVSRFVPPPQEPAGAPAPRIERFEAIGAEAEMRELARRVRALLDGGTRPEGIGVVARDLSPYTLPLRRAFRRLGIPFSGVGARAALLPAGRGVRAFLELLRRGEEVPSDRWLDAVASIAPPATGARRRLGSLLVDLRLAFYALGAGRLRDVAELQIDAFLVEGAYPLPIRQGLRSPAAREGGEEGDEAEAYAARRRVDGELIRAAVRTAGRVLDRFAGWPDEARAGQHFRRLRSLLTQDLGWSPGSELAAPILAAIAELEREIPDKIAFGRGDLRLLLTRALAGAGQDALGGAGGGVQVLTVTEARGRTFEHLFVPGLNRDLFPRLVREDPLLPDELRRVLRRVLPDMPVKSGGFDEERYLFAQLLAASPAVTLSWQLADADGRPLSPSPLLRGAREAEKAPPVWSLRGGAFRPADEQAVLAALHGPRQGFGPILAVALEEAGGERARDLAAIRLAVLDEMDPDLRTPEGRAVRSRLGPYFGFLGALGQGPDPRHMDLYVTHLEALAACPWQLFLGRLLRLEPTPDPLAALPGADALLLGNLVHKVLERIVNSQEGPGVRAIPWPSEADLDRLLREEAARLLAAEGITLPGLAHALADRVRPMLDSARRVDWRDPEAIVPVLRAEANEALEVRDAAGRSRTLRFRADRVDLAADGLRFTDYKTGKPISTARKPDARRKHFLDRVKAGTHLQAVAYLLAAGSEPALGRYLYLRPDVEERDFAVTALDRDFTEAFEAATAAALAAWDAGSFFPRVVDPAGRDEPPRCSWCAVAEACVRGDSGARLRLFEWSDRNRARRPEALDPAEEALLRVWRLPDRSRTDGEAADEPGEEPPA
jgi:RecB family exonuclease